MNAHVIFLNVLFLAIGILTGALGYLYIAYFAGNL